MKAIKQVHSSTCTYVVYYNEKIASSATHEAIDRKEVDLGKPETYLEEGKWTEHKMDEVFPSLKEWKVEYLFLSKYATI